MTEQKLQNTGEYEDLKPDQKTFVDWLCTPKKYRETSTQSELAEKLDVHRTTLSKWKYRPDIVRIVQRRKRQIAGVEDLPKVLEGVVERASDPGNQKNGHKDAKLFLQWLYGEEFNEGTQVNIQNQQSTSKAVERIANDEKLSERAKELFRSSQRE